MKRNEIRKWVAGLPNRVWRREIITSVGYKYVTLVSLCEGAEERKITVDEFYEDNENYITGCLYQ
jgi:hypothetical protein